MKRTNLKQLFCLLFVFFSISASADGPEWPGESPQAQIARQQREILRQPIDLSASFRALKFDRWTKHGVFRKAGRLYAKFEDLNSSFQIAEVLDQDTACDYKTDDYAEAYVLTNCIGLAVVKTTQGQLINAAVSVSSRSSITCGGSLLLTLASLGKCGLAEAPITANQVTPQLKNRIAEIFSKVNVLPTTIQTAE